MKGESKAVQLAEAFQRRIKSEALTPGTLLGTKATILQENDVSPGTLNEALRILQVRDYVVVRPGPKGGVFVGQQRQRSGLPDALLRAQARPQDIDQYLRIQEALHELVVSVAASSCGPRDASAIRRALDVLERATTTQEIFAADWEVDRRIAQAGNNSLLTEMYCAIIDTIESSIRWFDVDPELAEGARRVHAETARAVIANDVEAAVAAARLHSPPDGSGPAWRPTS